MHQLRLCTPPWLYMMQSVQVCFWHADVFIHGRMVGCCRLVLAYRTYISCLQVKAQDDFMVSVMSCACMHKRHAAHRKSRHPDLEKENSKCDLHWNVAAGA